jgi:hypothetical protein
MLANAETLNISYGSASQATPSLSASRLNGEGERTPHHHPRHKELRVGTLNAILSDVVAYLEMDREELAEDLLRR